MLPPRGLTGRLDVGRQRTGVDAMLEHVRRRRQARTAGRPGPWAARGRATTDPAALYFPLKRPWGEQDVQGGRMRA